MPRLARISDDPAGAWRMHLADNGGAAYVSDGRGQSPDGALSIAPADRAVQEDTLLATWVGPARLQWGRRASCRHP